VASARGAKSLAASALIVLLALGAWWLQDRSGGDDAGADPQPTRTAATSPTTAGTSPTKTATSVAIEEPPAYDDASGLPYVVLAALPPEAADTVRLIDAGGPFPYAEDGSTFHNFEGLLPGQKDGYYREYTVETPGSDDRGARRIIGGAEGELYWTADHYESFEVIRR
jgi:ribonuclease T1